VAKTLGVPSIVRAEIAGLIVPGHPNVTCVAAGIIVASIVEIWTMTTALWTAKAMDASGTLMMTNPADSHLRAPLHLNVRRNQTKMSTVEMP